MRKLPTLTNHTRTHKHACTHSHTHTHTHTHTRTHAHTHTHRGGRGGGQHCSCYTAPDFVPNLMASSRAQSLPPLVKPSIFFPHLQHLPASTTHRAPEQNLHHRFLLVPQTGRTHSLEKGHQLGVRKNLRRMRSGGEWLTEGRVLSPQNGGQAGGECWLFSRSAASCCWLTLANNKSVTFFIATSCRPGIVCRGVHIGPFPAESPPALPGRAAPQRQCRRSAITRRALASLQHRHPPENPLESCPGEDTFVHSRAQKYLP